MAHTWLWILNGFITVGCMIAYVMTDGKNLVLKYYIPLDFLFNISRTAYFWYRVFLDRKQMQNKEKIRKRAEHEHRKIQNRELAIDQRTPGMEQDDTASNASY